MAHTTMRFHIDHTPNKVAWDVWVSVVFRRCWGFVSMNSILQNSTVCQTVNLGVNIANSNCWSHDVSDVNHLQTTGMRDVHHQEAIMRLCTSAPPASTSLLMCYCPLLLMTFPLPWHGHVPFLADRLESIGVEDDEKNAANETSNDLTLCCRLRGHVLKMWYFLTPKTRQKGSSFPF